MREKVNIVLCSFLSDFSNTSIIYIFTLIIGTRHHVIFLALLWMVYDGGSFISHALMGTMVDQLNNKYLMLFSELSRLVIIGILCLSLVISHEQVVYFIVGVGILGLVEPLFHPVAMGVMYQLFKKDEWMKLNSMLELSDQSTSIIGPLLGGFLVIVVGPSYALLFVMLVLALSIVSVLSLPFKKQETSTKKDGRWYSGLVEGYSYVKKHHKVFLTSFTVLGLNISLGMITPYTLPLINQLFKGGEEKYLIITSVESIGVLMGALFLFKSKRVQVHNQLTSMLRSAFLMGVIIMLIAISKLYVLFIFLYMALGVFTSKYNIENAFIYQSISNEAYVGRVFAFKGLVAVAGFIIGTGIGSLTINHLSLNYIFLLAGVIAVIFVFCSMYYAKRNGEFMWNSGKRYR